MSIKRTRQQARTEARRQAKTPRHTVSTVSAMQALLQTVPSGAKLYVDVEGDVVVRQGTTELARVALTGY